MVFGASLLGAATASCVPEPRSDPALSPPSLVPARRAAEERSSAGEAHDSTESAPKLADSGPASSEPPSTPNDYAQLRPMTVVPVYGGSMVIIPSEVVYTRHSLVIDAEGERTLAALTEVLDAFDCDIVIRSYPGSDEAAAAEWLAKRRAQLVRKRLIALGADSKRLSIETPAASPPLPTRGPGRDRRVAFSFNAQGNNPARPCDESDIPKQ
jgi:flagellar motor protein MotB